MSSIDSQWFFGGLPRIEARPSFGDTPANLADAFGVDRYRALGGLWRQGRGSALGRGRGPGVAGG